MKKLLLFAAISISVTALAQHPTDKGWRSVGGSGNIHIDLDGDDGTYHNFTLSPEVYWFVGNSFAIGADFGFSLYSGKREDSTVLTKSQSIDMWIAPGVRYYMRDPEKKWRPYAFGNAGYQYSTRHYTLDYRSSATPDVDANSNNGGLTAYAGLGLAWFFSDHAAFDIRMNVVDFYPGFDSNGRDIVEFDYSPSFKIGVQAFFD